MTRAVELQRAWSGFSNFSISFTIISVLAGRFTTYGHGVAYAFVPGPWTLGRKYRWINPPAIIWVGICVVIFILPFTPAAVPVRTVELDEDAPVT